MYRKSLLALSVLFSLCFTLFCCSPHPLPSRNEHSVVPYLNHPLQTSVAVMLIRPTKIALIGSGVVLKCDAGEPMQVITAWHVVDAIIEDNPAAPILIGSAAKQRYIGMKILKTDPEHDLALLEGISKELVSCPAATVAKELPLIGSPVWIIGNPSAIEGNISHGILSNAYMGGENKTTMLYRTDAAGAPGNSGGGLFNDKGELIGIISFLQLNIYGVIPGSTNAIGLPHLWMLVG